MWAHDGSMKLSEKGRFAPPPPLPKLAQRVAETVGAWDGVHARTHWLLGDENEVDGADFYLGQEELGHIHLDGEAHVFLPRSIVASLVAAGLGRPFEWSANVVVLRIVRAKDVEHALWLFELSRDRRRGATVGSLAARVASRGAPTELAP